MSIEAAIADHAAAIRELAAAIRSTVGAQVAAVSQAAAAVEVVQQVKAEVAEVEEKPAAEAEAKPTTAKAAVQAALEAAKTASVEVAEEPAAGPLSYEKDVQPLLLQVGKNRDQLVELLRKFNAKNGAGIKDSDYHAVVAEAKAIIAARG